MICLILTILYTNFVRSTYVTNCIFDGDILHYANGDPISNSLSSININSLNLSNATALADKSPWTTKEVGEDLKRTTIGNTINLGGHRLGFVTATTVNIKYGFVIYDINSGKLSSPKPGSVGPFSIVDGVKESFLLSTTVKEDDDNYFNLGGFYLDGKKLRVDKEIRTLNIKTFNWSKFPGTCLYCIDSSIAYYDNKLFSIVQKKTRLPDRDPKSVMIFDTQTKQWTESKTTGDIPEFNVLTDYLQLGELVYLVGELGSVKPSDVKANFIHTFNLKTLVWTKHIIPGFQALPRRGCLANYKGILVINFGSINSLDDPTYMIDTKKWSLIDYKSIGKKGVSISTLADAINNGLEANLNLDDKPGFNPNSNSPTNLNPDSDTNPNDNSTGFNSDTTTRNIIITVTSLFVAAVVGVCLWFYKVRKRSLNLVTAPPPNLDPNWKDLKFDTSTFMSLTVCDAPYFDNTIAPVRLLGHDLASFKTMDIAPNPVHLSK